MYFLWKTSFGHNALVLYLRSIMEITVKTAQQLRLTADEFELIKQKMGRTPNFTELCAFSGM